MSERHEVAELLTAAIPDLSDADLLTGVEERLRRARRRRATVAVGCGVLLIVMVTAFVTRQVRDDGTPSRDTVATGATVLPPAECPPRSEAPPDGGQGDPGPLVPDGAVAVTLCAYRPDVGAPGGWRADRPARLTAGVGEVADSLNDLPRADGPPDGCFLALRSEYVMVFDYPDRSLAVEIDLGCGTAESAGAARRGEVTAALDRFAENYRAGGGELSGPPW